MYYRFDFDEAVLLSTQSNLISFTFTELENEPSFIHSHPYTEIVIPQNENGKIVCAALEHKIKSNTIYVIPSNISHTELNLNKESKFRYFVLKIRDNINKPSSLDELFLVSLDYGFFNELNTYLKTASKYLQRGEKKNILFLNIYTFYRSFIDYLDEHGYLISVQKPIAYSCLILEVKNYISKNYHYQLTIDKIAAAFNLSRSSLEKKFKKEIGITPNEYLINHRITTAKHLLKTTNYTISQISSICGFVSPAYFTHSFKKQLGLTPKKFKLDKSASVADK